MTARLVEIIFFDAGGGHRNAMLALTRLIETSHPDWTVVPVDLQKLLEPIDPVHRMTQRLNGSLSRFTKRFSFAPMQAQDIYNGALKRGTTHGLGAILPILQHFVRRFSPEIEALLLKRWQSRQTQRPDLVVSVIPNFNRPIWRALQQFAPDIPYITVMTDMVDLPPHFWMEDQDQYVVCGTPKAYAQAQLTGYYRPERLFNVSGMILKEAFYKPSCGPALSRADLGLAEGRPTAMIMFGGNGSLRATQTILAQFDKAALDIQTVVMCGNNGKLLESLKGRPNCHAVGFVQNVADYMRLSDFFIGKPGPGSVSEAVHMGCPVIVERNAATMPQERPNTDWIRENGAGIVVNSFRRGIADAAASMMRDLAIYRENISRIPGNRAVFEVVDVLDGIMQQKNPRYSPHIATLRAIGTKY